MKKALLAGSALVAASLINSNANAEVTIGGFGAVMGTVVSHQINGEDSAEHNPNRLQNDFEIHFSASNETSVGTISTKIELQAGDWYLADGDAAADVDKATLTLSGGWGSLTLGTEDGADDQSGVYWAGSVAQRGMLDWSPQIDGIDPDGDEAPLGEYNVILMETDSGTANKITYQTPDMGGATAAVSYTPAQQNTAIRVGYETQAGGADMGVMATYAYDKNPEEDLLGTAQNSTAWTLSAKAGLAGAELYASYQKEDNHFRSQDKGYTLGVSYALGDLTLRGQYADAKRTYEGEPSEVFEKLHSFGVSYNLGGGATAFISYADVSVEDTINLGFTVSVDRQVGTAGLAVSF